MGRICACSLRSRLVLYAVMVEIYPPSLYFDCQKLPHWSNISGKKMLAEIPIWALFIVLLLLEATSPLHVWSKVCIALFMCGAKYEALFHVRCKVAQNQEWSNVSFLNLYMYIVGCPQPAANYKEGPDKVHFHSWEESTRPASCI